ncbi:Long-chain-fatty-acid--CoA ligase [Rhodococcus sp. WAY2]|nr:Long-chain-fatty-acid--CoA ligase [Rhodococcus sp. WAY2]
MGDIPARTALDMFESAVVTARDGPAVRYLGGTLGYREVDQLTDGIAAYLLENGFQRGDRLAIYLQNIPQFVLALIGTWKAGGVVVPLNPMYRDELAHILTDAGVTAIVCSESSWADRVGSRASEAGVRIALTSSELDIQTSNDERLFRTVTRARSENVPDLLEVARVRAGATVPDPGLTPEDIALVSYTSGTSGVPKGATNTHRNLTVNSAILRLYEDKPAGAPIFALAPLFHITGMVCQLLTAIDLASPLILVYRFEPGVVLDALERERPIFMVGPSTAYMALMAHPDFSGERFASLEAVMSGGAPLPPAIVERFRELTGKYIRNGYGLTETSAPCVVVPPNLEAPVDPASGTLAIGLPLPSAVVRIIGEDGKDLEPLEVGEIAVDGPMVVPAYWNKPDATAQSLPGGRLLTGDVGFMDAEGWVYVVDRKKDMINASGFKVWPREVEDVLYQHPAVREAAVVGEPDSYRGETVAAFVSLRPGTTVETADLVEYCRERLATYKAPRRVEIVDELPKTASGKILRREMRRRAPA